MHSYLWLHCEIVRIKKLCQYALFHISSCIAFQAYAVVVMLMLPDMTYKSTHKRLYCVSGFSLWIRILFVSFKVWLQISQIYFSQTKHISTFWTGHFPPPKIYLYANTYSNYLLWKTPLANPGIPGWTTVEWDSKYGSQWVWFSPTVQYALKILAVSFFMHIIVPFVVDTWDVSKRSPSKHILKKKSWNIIIFLDLYNSLSLVFKNFMWPNFR